MALAHTLTERRKLLRVDLSSRVELDMLSIPRRLNADSINFNEGGMCVRVQEALEISSQVRMRLFAQSLTRPLEFGGRVAWVIQRLDLRDIPPFLYDVGVEFVNPPARLRAFASRIGVAMKTVSRPIKPSLQPFHVQNRCYTPRVARESSLQGSWHLVVLVEGAPCFSGRYASERDALQAWEQFKRRTTTISRGSGVQRRASRKETSR